MMIIGHCAGDKGGNSICVNVSIVSETTSGCHLYSYYEDIMILNGLRKLHFKDTTTIFIMYIKLLAKNKITLYFQ